MKRINITRVAPVLAFLASIVLASALTGCVGQATSTEGTDESSLVSNRAHAVADAEERNAALNSGPARALELKTRTGDEGQGPHPEPWLDQEGPHPEPWQSKNLSYSPPDPNNNGNTKP